jgi:hypothetical protein
VKGTPVPEPGCTGNCFSIGAKSEVIDCNFTTLTTSGCGAKTLLITKSRVCDTLKNEIKNINSTYNFDDCSKGCSCQNKKEFKHETKELVFKNLVISADQIKKGCKITITGSVTIKISKGWMGSAARIRRKRGTEVPGAATLATDSNRLLR